MKKLLHDLFNFDHLAVCITTLLLTALLVFLSFNITFLNPVARAVQEFSLSDLYYKVAWDDDGRPAMSNNITLVDITPLRNRADIGAVLDDVRRAGPAAVGVDVIFEGERDDVAADLALAEAALELPQAVFANKLTDYDGAKGEFTHSVQSFFATPETREGYTNAVGDMAPTCLRSLSVERRLNGRAVRSFTAAVAETYQGRALPADQCGDRLINYRFVDFPVVSHDSVALHPDLVKDRIVLLGTPGEEQDMHFTPLGKMSGLKVQAYAIQTLIDQRNVTTVGTDWQLLVSFIVCYLTAFWQYHWLRFTGRRKTPFGVFLSNSKILLRLITFAWLGLLVWLSYILYERFDVYVPMGLILAPVILVSESRGIYTALIRGLAAGRFGRIFGRSRYA